MANINPAKFVREVRQEMDKVTWPTRKETTVSTIMVLVLVSLTAIFFVVVYSTIRALVDAIIGI